MELLIPGLILVAVMAYVSTRIKKRAAEAFKSESVVTDRYVLEKPEGFLHVIGDREHEFMAYSNEFGEDENARLRRATIELDILRGTDLAKVRESIRGASVTSELLEGDIVSAEELANETEFRTVYKLTAHGDAVYRLRFAVLAEYFADFSSRVDETIRSFATK